MLSLRRDPSEAKPVHTLSVCSGTDCKKPNPLCDVTGVKFQREEGGGCGALPLWTLTNEKQFGGAPAYKKKRFEEYTWRYALSILHYVFSAYYLWGGQCATYAGLSLTGPKTACQVSPILLLKGSLVCIQKSIGVKKNIVTLKQTSIPRGLCQYNMSGNMFWG